MKLKKHTLLIIIETIIVAALLVFFTVRANARGGRLLREKKQENGKSDYLRGSYKIPAEYSTHTDEMTGAKKTISPGIILHYSGYGWDHIGFWWTIQDDNGDKDVYAVIKLRLEHWLHINEVYMKAGETVYHFSPEKKNFSNNENIACMDNVSMFEKIVSIPTSGRTSATSGAVEFVTCLMGIEKMKKLINAESFKISIRGKNGKRDYTIYREPEWIRLENI